MEHFLPEPLLSEVRSLASEFHVIDSQQVKGEAMSHAIAHVDPDVLIASWRTDPLPEQLPPGLRYVCFLGGSVRRLIRLSHLQRGLLVTNWGKSASRTVAEGTLMLMLMSLRLAGDMNTRMHRDGYWINGTTAPTRSLISRRVGLHGLGNVSRELVRLLHCFGVEITAYDPYVAPEVFTELRVRRAGSLMEIFTSNDVVVELAALSPETAGSVTSAHFAALPEGAVFVNTGRGAVVDEDALISTARSGRIFFALDVFHHEPLPADYPLRGLPNVILLPHIAGPTPDRRVDAGLLALENLRRFCAGQPLEAVVTSESYTRST